MEWRPKDIHDAKFSNADLSGPGMFCRLAYNLKQWHTM